MRTLDLNEEEKSARVKEQNRLRAAKYYASKKNVINEKAKVLRKSKNPIVEATCEIITLPKKTAFTQKEGKLTSTTTHEDTDYVPSLAPKKLWLKQKREE